MDIASFAPRVDTIRTIVVDIVSDTVLSVVDKSVDPRRLEDIALISLNEAALKAITLENAWNLALDLNRHDIEELDEKLDAAVPSQSLLSRPRESALIHLLRAHESYMVGHISNPNRGERENASTYGIDAMNHAVRWISQFCPAGTCSSNLAFKESVYLEAEELHRVAREYSKVWDLMSMLHRGLIGAIWEGEHTIGLKFSSDLNMELNIAGNFIATPYGPELGEPLVTPNVAKDIVNSVSVQRIQPQLTYQMSDGLFNRLLERVSRMTTEPWKWIQHGIWEAIR